MEARIKRRVAEILVAILLCLVWVPPAHAACANPSGSAGDMRYNPGFKAPEYCDGAAWVAMGAAGDTRTGLAGWWKFDDGSGTSAADSSGNGHTGTLTNGPAWTTGINGGALTFNGSADNFVRVPDFLGAETAVTVSAWVYANSWSSDFYAQIAGEVENTGQSPFLALYEDSTSGDYIEFGVVTSLGANQLARFATPATGAWFHVVGAYDGSNVKIYKNGVLMDTEPLTGTLEDQSNIFTIGGKWQSGIYPSGGFDLGFNGIIDDVRVYKRALSAQDALALYNSTGPLSGDINSNLVGWWKLDDGSSGTTPTTAADSSGNGNTGATQGSPVWTSAGKIGNALTLNGTSQYLDIPTTATLSFERTNPFSLTGWIYRTNATGEDDIFGKVNSGTTARGYALWMPSNGESLWCPGSCSTNSCIDFDLNSNVSSSNELCVHVNSSGITTGAWHFVAATYDGSSTISGMKVYVDGVPQTATSSTNSLSATIISSSDLVVGTDSPAGSDYFGGSIDDLRVYSRALSQSDVLTLYNATATSCANPVAQAGHMIYNAGSYHVLQYCDGAAWKALGPVMASTGSGCASPTGGEGDIIYNSARGYMQYCNGANWIAMGSSYYGPQQGLVGWWKLDDGSGTSAADSSGNGNTGTLQNSPTWTTAGMNNGALTFNGTSQYVSAGDPADLQITGSFTISGWFNASSFPGTDDNPILEKVTSAAGFTADYAIAVTRDNGPQQLYVLVSSDGLDVDAVNRYSSTTISAGQWYHVAGVYDAVARTLHIYVNGALDDGLIRGAVPAAAYNTTGATVVLGKRLTSVVYFAGLLDDVRVYNRALSASEVWQLYLVTGGQ